MINVSLVVHSSESSQIHKHQIFKEQNVIFNKYLLSITVHELPCYMLQSTEKKIRHSCILNIILQSLEGSRKLIKIDNNF